MQQRVQQEILRLIDDAGLVDVRAVSRKLPETDARDLTRALQIRLREGLIEGDRRRAPTTRCVVVTRKNYPTNAGACPRTP
jgi:hypothetical protein